MMLAITQTSTKFDAMHLLTLSGIYKKEANNFFLQEINFNLQRLQKIAIAGETGSGKSTLLKIIAGWIQPDAGEVLFENKRVRGPKEELIPGHRGIAYLSQHFELRTNYRVEEVLEYANKLSIEEAQTIYAICRIDHLLKRKTDQLSGGEKQRIALARLLISSPRLLLLDEPFSNLDMILKNILKSVIHDLGKRLNITCMLVSHDPLDTLSWADEIMVMKNGQIVQIGSPAQIYRQPVNEYVAGLFGKYSLLNEAQAKAFPAFAGIHLDSKHLLIRPEQVTITSKKNRAITGKVKQVRFFGSYYEVEVVLPENNIIVKTEQSNLAKGDTVYINLSPDDVWYL